MNRNVNHKACKVKKTHCDWAEGEKLHGYQSFTVFSPFFCIVDDARGGNARRSHVMCAPPKQLTKKLVACRQDIILLVKRCSWFTRNVNVNLQNKWQILYEVIHISLSFPPTLVSFCLCVLYVPREPYLDLFEGVLWAISICFSASMRFHCSLSSVFSIIFVFFFLGCATGVSSIAYSISALDAVDLCAWNEESSCTRPLTQSCCCFKFAFTEYYFILFSVGANNTMRRDILYFEPNSLWTVWIWDI